jgi:hypothetical protein
VSDPAYTNQDKHCWIGRKLTLLFRFFVLPHRIILNLLSNGTCRVLECALLSSCAVMHAHCIPTCCSPLPAIKFTSPSGTVALSVESQLVRGNEYEMTFSVKDSVSWNGVVCLGLWMQ